MVSRENLQNKEQTANRMYQLVERFAGDLANWTYKGVRVASLPFSTWYNTVRKIPYRRDNPSAEVVARPDIALRMRRSGLDCKKKSILIGAFCRMHGLPYKFAGVSGRPDGRIHHVVPVIKFRGQWVPADATYRRNNFAILAGNPTAIEVF